MKLIYVMNPMGSMLMLEFSAVVIYQFLAKSEEAMDLSQLLSYFLLSVVAVSIFPVLYSCEGNE